jgi:hypothetical protein
MRTEIKPEDDFHGYKEPLGTRITLHPSDTIRTRLAKAFFAKELFSYFEQVANGQTGWGISYNTWLEMNGWKLTGFTTYERVPAMIEE